MELKKCEVCDDLKGLSEFSKSYKNRCKPCVARLEKAKRKASKVKNDTKAIELFNQEFGTNVQSRLRKLREESLELVEAIESNNVDDILDEMSDVLAVLLHTSSIMGKSLPDLLSNAMDKVQGRKEDPNYKRKHPHVKNG